MKKHAGIIIIVVVLLYLTSCTVLFSVAMSDGTTIPDGNVAIIPVEGVISLGSSGFGGFNYEFVKDSIRTADKDSSIKAIVLSINSPGGSPVASDEIGQIIQNAEKPTVAWIREVGASGGYWIATNTDYIIANRMSVTGSIGVLSSYLEFSGLLEEYNVTYQQLNAGKYKDITSPFKPLTEEEKNIMQEKINKIHEFFIIEVAQNRNMEVSEVREAATGIIYLGVEAQALGLVDELGGEEEVKAYLEELLEEKVEFAFYERKVGFAELFYGVMSKQTIKLSPEIELR